MGIFDASKISDDQLNIHIQKLRPVQEKDKFMVRFILDPLHFCHAVLSSLLLTQLPISICLFLKNAPVHVCGTQYNLA